jgi:probable DNA metabolism protein
MEQFYDGTPEGLFTLLGEALDSGIIPDQVRRYTSTNQEDKETPFLFTEAELGLPPMLNSDTQKQRGLEAMEQLRTLSEAAFQDCLQAWMSDEPIEADIIRYAVRILTAPNHSIAEQLRTDRSFSSCQIVLNASQRYLRELDRFLGLLRFKPTKEGYLVAKCEPDACILPGLAHHLKRRFGTTAWAVQDEKRHLVLACNGSEEPELASYEPENPPFSPPEGLVPDEYEALWQEYYHSINIESRKNPELRKRLMPLKFWKYLPELQVRP